ncbi:hypothetical protein SIN8267_01644 [Sinobacterium norvegicum]|uniref:Uncharacterized protein n=1 Tax=Sinobacterium norvegicum TaxID=1641715 RepID=A0ABM9AEM0_9GAMM|nr:DUF6388 family protein [Sinobacterium norvegicum]CAH0991536.1 hypothetical protein SIN8267_01644 [Sinobacterium norvegicum]
MLVAKSKRYEVACDRFLAAHPLIQTEVEELDDKAASAQGLSCEQLKANTVYGAFAAHAQKEGMDTAEYTLSVLADSPEELKQMQLEYQHETAEALGMTWDEYCDEYGEQ